MSESTVLFLIALVAPGIWGLFVNWALRRVWPYEKRFVPEPEASDQIYVDVSALESPLM